MADEPESLVLQLLRGIRADMATKSDVNALRVDVASDSAAMQAERKATRERIAGLRRAAVERHSAVIGHGALISELEARVRQVEQHLNLPALDAG